MHHNVYSVCYMKQLKEFFRYCICYILEWRAHWKTCVRQVIAWSGICSPAVYFYADFFVTAFFTSFFLCCFFLTRLFSWTFQADICIEILVIYLVYLRLSAVGDSPSTTIIRLKLQPLVFRSSTVGSGSHSSPCSGSSPTGEDCFKDWHNGLWKM